MAEEGGYLVVPQSVLEIFGTGLSFLFSKQYFVLFLPFLLLSVLEWLFLIFFPSLRLNDLALTGFLPLKVSFLGLITFFGYLLAIGIDTSIVADELLGIETSLGKGYEKVFEVFRELLVGSFLVALLVFSPMFIVLFPLSFLQKKLGEFAIINLDNSTINLLGILGLVCFALQVIFLIWFCLTPVCIVLEKNRAINAMNKSRELTRGNWFHVLGVIFLISVIFSITSSAASFIGKFVNGSFAGTLLGPFAFLVETIISNLVGPISVGMLVALYFDLLARKPYLKSL